VSGRGVVGRAPVDDPSADVLVEVRRGDAGELHGDVGSIDPDGVTIRWCVPQAAAVVLGSRQSDDTVDPDRCAASGLAVVRRRSGGGAVLVDPEAAIWIDVLVPLPSRVIPDDLRASMVVVGRWWRAALDSVLRADTTPPADLAVHDGAVTAGEWGEVVCFAGLGPGEVTLRGAKLVGLSQRRTRDLARFQSQVHLTDPTDRLVGVLSRRPGGPPPRPALLEPGSRAGTDVTAIAETLLGALARSVSATGIA